MDRKGLMAIELNSPIGPDREDCTIFEAIPLEDG
jgi:hypothetical protein